jgi:hypothetical protein
MYGITARNPSEGLRIAIRRLLELNNIIDTRNGKAYTYDEPILVTFTHPKECFVNDPVRDANPFFALAEAFWLLAGRDDTAFLDKYVKTFGERYSDQGILMGSYGKRWRKHFGIDQIKAVIEKLRDDPGTRQAVIQMWDANDLTVQAKDRPCNLSVVFRIRKGNLDITVMNRSNDIVNGMMGYNPTQFSMLQRVVADHLGIPVGKYWVCSNDAHVYVSDLEMLNKRGELSKTIYPAKKLARIVENLVTWESDLNVLMDCLDALHSKGKTDEPVLKNRFLSEVVFRACVSYYFHKQKRWSESWLVADTISDLSWRQFCIDWLERRAKNEQRITDI